MNPTLRVLLAAVVTITTVGAFVAPAAAAGDTAVQYDQQIEPLNIALDGVVADHNEKECFKDPNGTAEICFDPPLGLDAPDLSDLISNNPVA